jgi:hypothetical protein
VYGSWAPEGSLSGTPFVFPHARFLRRDATSPTGYRASVPGAYAPGVWFQAEFTALDGLGTTSPLLVSDDFLGAYFDRPAGVRIGLIAAATGEPVTLATLPKAPAGLHGAQPASPLTPDADYWMTLTGSPSLMPCEGGPVVALVEDEAEAGAIEARLRKSAPAGKRTLVLPFHTQRVIDPLLTAARVADDSAGPAVLSARAYAPTDATGKPTYALFKQFPKLIRGIQYGEEPWMPLGHLGKVVLGEIDSLEFREGTRLGDRPADHGHRKLEFLLTLPKPGPVRPRLVLFSHPLRACKEAVMGLADTLAQYGFAMAAIDHVEHGSRQSDPPGDYVCGTSIPWAFFGGGNPAVLRDNVRQSSLDLYQFKLALQRAGAATFDFDGDGVKDFTSDRPGLVAMSLGSIIAVPFLAIAPDVGVAVLNTALGTTIELLDQHNEGTSRYNLPFPGPMPSLNLAITQSILEAGEPVNFAAALRESPRDLLVQEVVDDAVVPNSSTDKLARELALTLAGPVSRHVAGVAEAPAPYHGQPTHALYQVPNVNHSFLLIPRNRKVLAPARRQVAAFLYSHFVTGAAEVLPIEFGK